MARPVVVVVVVVAVLVVGLAGLMTSALPSVPIGSARAELLTLCQDFWDWRTQEFPYFSTLVSPDHPFIVWVSSSANSHRGPKIE